MFLSIQQISGIYSQGTGWVTKRVSRKKELRTEHRGPLMCGNLDHEGCPAKKTETMWPLHRRGKETNQKGRKTVFKLSF